jgi:hypothetical protein
VLSLLFIGEGISQTKSTAEPSANTAAEERGVSLFDKIFRERFGGGRFAFGFSVVFFFLAGPDRLTEKLTGAQPSAEPAESQSTESAVDLTDPTT